MCVPPHKKNPVRNPVDVGVMDRQLIGEDERRSEASRDLVETSRTTGEMMEEAEGF